MECDSLPQDNKKWENQRNIQKHRKTKLNEDIKKFIRKCKLYEYKHIMHG